MTSAVIADLLRSLGLNAHVTQGFNVARSVRRESLHGAVVVRDLQTKDDAFLFDLGTFAPFVKPMEITKLIGPKTTDNRDQKELIVARKTPVSNDLDFEYQIVKGRHLANAFCHTVIPQSNSEKDQTMSSCFDLHQVQAGLHANEGDALVTMVANHDLIGIVMHSLASEPKGVWMPLYVFPTPPAAVGIEAISERLSNPTDSHYKAMVQVCCGGVFLAGFGDKSGDYLMLSKDKYVRLKQSMDFRSQVETFQSKSDILELVAEEFPIVFDQCKDASTMWPVV